MDIKAVNQVIDERIDQLAEAEQRERRVGSAKANAYSLAITELAKIRFKINSCLNT